LQNLKQQIDRLMQAAAPRSPQTAQKG